MPIRWPIDAMPCHARIYIQPNQTNHSSTSVNFLKILRLKIIVNSATVTTTSNPNPNHPSTIADVPTPLFTLPLPMSFAIVLAATDAVCCHRTETRTKTAATKTRARATWETGRLGKGFTSCSEPVSSVSSCQPGNVARRMKQRKEKTTAMILFFMSSFCC